MAVGEAPVIRSPAARAEYRLRNGIKPEFQQILFEASASKAAGVVVQTALAWTT